MFHNSGLWKPKIVELSKEVKYAYCRDVSASGAKNFVDVQSHREMAEYIVSLPPQARVFYETVKDSIPVKMFFDIETDPQQEEPLDKHEARAKLLELMELVRHNLMEFWDQDIDINNFSKIDSSNEIKTSFHLILTDGPVFKDRENLNKCMKDERLWPSEKMKSLHVDMGVYNKNGHMRILGSQKMKDLGRFFRADTIPGFTQEQIDQINNQILTPDQHDNSLLVEAMLRCGITNVNPAAPVIKFDLREMRHKIDKKEKVTEHTPPMPNRDDALREIAVRTAEADIDHVNNYDKWIKMGRMLKSAGADEDIFHEFSKLSSKYDRDVCAQKWETFTVDHNPDILYMYVNSRYPEIIADVMKGSLENMSHLSYSIAFTMAHRYSSSYVYDPDIDTWFFKENNKWREDRSRVRMVKLMLDKFMKEVENQLIGLKAREKKGEAVSNRIEEFKKIQEKCQNGRLDKDWNALQSAFCKCDFSRNLDSCQNLIGFENGIIDLAGNYVCNEKNEYVLKEQTDEDGEILRDQSGKPIYVRLRDPTKYDIRTPGIYLDKNGNERMEFVSMSTGYSFYSEEYLKENNSSEYRRQKKLQKKLQNYLTQVFPDKTLKEYFLCTMAIALNGAVNPQIIHFWTGTNKFQTGSNSKSLLSDLMRQVFGDYAQTAASTILTNPPAGAEKPNPALMALRNRRLVFFNEPESGKDLQSETIKQLTGDDEISARELNKPQITFKNKAMLNVLANDIGRPSQTDDGFWRRIKFIPFQSKFVLEPDDPKYDKIRKDKAGNVKVHPLDYSMTDKLEYWRLPFMWLLLETHAKLATKKFKLPKCALVDKYTKKYETEHDIVKEWLKECTAFDEGSIVTFAELKVNRNAEISRRFPTDKKLREEIETKWGPISKKPIEQSGETVVALHWLNRRLKTEEERELDETNF